MIELNLDVETENNIYIDLDSILDSRAGVLWHLDRNVYNKVVGNKIYNSRVIDEFEHIPYSVFIEYYRYRNVDVLKRSYFTKITDMLNIIVGNFTKNIHMLNSGSGLRIVINTYPYMVDETIKKYIFHYIVNNMVAYPMIDYTYIDLEYTNIYDVINDYKVMIAYNGLQWLNVSMTDIKKITKLDNKPYIMVPKLINDPIILDSVDNYEIMFSDLEDMYRDLVNLEFIDIELFNELYRKDSE